jgi:Ni2+-binding GTPase involved in maturation of urease and hydrogenase
MMNMISLAGTEADLLVVTEADLLVVTEADLLVVTEADLLVVTEADLLVDRLLRRSSNHVFAELGSRTES